MNAAGAFFCIRCNKLEDRGQAGSLFRTGYFRVIHPLGFCVSCYSEVGAAADQLSSASREMAAGTTRPFYDGQPFGNGITSNTPSEDRDRNLVPAHVT